jgi:predicted MFS family arabinose efflux permease
MKLNDVHVSVRRDHAVRHHPHRRVVRKKSGSWGRKPLLLIAFGVLPIRAVLYTLTSNTVALVAIQVLDGVGAGIFGVVSIPVIADLTQGSGRFNITLGAIATAVGIGASLSQTIAGAIVHHFSFNTGFLFLAVIAAAAFAILYFHMPETREKSFLNEHP